jgi:phosphoadenosine phosphosulfate reductase
VENSTTIQERIQHLSLPEIIVWIATNYPNVSVFSTSLGMEDQIITHEIFQSNSAIEIFTLDTGRLFNETYTLLSATNQKYNAKIKVYYPNQDDLQTFVGENGINCFYESVDKRKACCHIRKVAPLQRALKNKEIWITGIRAEQSGNRTGMPMVEWDETNQILKIHPLLNWTNKDVTDYIAQNQIQVNPLHSKGYASIGCQPCTRAIEKDEDIRAGRWWWETSNKKECGLHH